MINNYSISGIIAHQKEQCHSEGAQRATVGIHIRNLSPEQTLLLWIATLTLAMTPLRRRLRGASMEHYVGLNSPPGAGWREAPGRVFWIVRNVERLEINPLPSSTALPHTGGEQLLSGILFLEIFFKRFVCSVYTCKFGC